jgi:hypothetical protein
MAKARIRSAESFRYVPEADRALPVEEQSTFILNPLTGPERARLMDEATVTHVLSDGTKEIVDRTYRQARENVRAHLVSIENFPPGAPKAWPAKAREQDEYLELLDDGLLLEIHNEHFTRSWLGADAKNFSLPEPMSGSGAP